MDLAAQLERQNDPGDVALRGSLRIDEDQLGSRLGVVAGDADQISVAFASASARDEGYLLQPVGRAGEIALQLAGVEVEPAIKSTLFSRLDVPS